MACDKFGKMSYMKESVLIEASVEVVSREKFASNLAEILHLDLTTCKVEDFAEFYSDFEFEVNCDCKITAIGKENFLNYLFVPCLSLGSNNFWTGPKHFGHRSKNKIQ